MILLEGGNLTIDGVQADQLDLKATKRSFIVPILNDLLHNINALYQKQYKKPLWDPKLLNSGAFLSGSSLHFFNVKGISDEEFVAKKPKVGDIDTMVNRDERENLVQFLTTLQGKKIGDATLLGFHTAGGEQYSGLWQLGTPPSIKVQIDFEFVEFDQNGPTDWAKFSHSSSWRDLSLGIKGVFHKWLTQSLAAITYRDFLQRKLVGRGKARAEQDVPMKDTMLSFAVASKEGGGLRAKYLPVIDPNTNKPLVKDGLPVMTAAPTAGYEQNVQQIFTKLFGKKIDAKALENTWSFDGILDLMNKLLTPEQKNTVFQQFLQKTVGPAAQGMYKNDPNRDLSEKTVAINHAMKKLGIAKPNNLDQMMVDYKKAYRMTPITNEDAEPSYKRKGIPHIYNPGSSVEMKDAEFIRMCQEIANMGGKLDDADISLKVDGGPIRFGKDPQGNAFFMTGKDAKPMYINNYGDYTRNIGPELKKYDEVLKIVLSSDFIKKIPKDTIVEAEMMYTPAGKVDDQGVRFVRIAYDPKKLGSVLTIVPHSVKTYSTGEESPYSDKIKQMLMSYSNKEIKMVNNQLSQTNLDVSKIVNPIAKNADALLAAIKSRGDSEQKTKAKELLAEARKKLSDTIIASPNIKGKDQLGNMIEGLVIKLPSGLAVKVTSSEMKERMAKNPNARATGKTVVVYGGGFQPFHQGHLSSYLQAKKAFPNADFYVAASGNVKERPIPYQEKKFLATQAGVQPADFPDIEVKTPINPREILQKYNPEKDAFILVRSERDPIAYTKKDGTPGYFQPYNPNQPLQPFGNHGYVFVTSKHDFNINGESVYSGTQVRNMYQNADDAGRLSIIKQLYPRSKQHNQIKQILDKHLVNNAVAAMESIKALYARIKPLINEATTEQKERLYKLLENAKQQAGIAIAKKKEQGVEENTVKSKISTTDFVQKLVLDFNAEINPKGGEFVPLQFKLPGTRVWTRGDGARMRDPGFIFLNKHLNAQEYKIWYKQNPLEKFWQMLLSKGARKIGDVSGALGSEPFKPAVVLNKLIFVNNGNNIAWGSTNRLKNSNVWRQKQQEGVAEGTLDESVRVIEKDGIQFKVTTDTHNVEIHAMANGRELGYVVFDRERKNLTADDLHIDERYRGQGIAKLMYDCAKELGFKVKRSYAQTDDGKHFWDKNRGEEVNVWEDASQSESNLPANSDYLPEK